MKKTIGVIGQGFVGGSLTTVFSERGFKVNVYDITGKVAEGGQDVVRPLVIAGVDNIPKFPWNATISLEEQQLITHEAKFRLFVETCELDNDFSKVFFVCLPTPMYEDGSADLSIVEGALKFLSEVPGERVAVVKSTVPPGSTEAWNKKFAETGLTVVFNPEFLTEQNALDDMRNQNRIVLGGPRPHINKVKQIFQTAFPHVPVVKTSSTTAEMVKYFTNVHLAVRVILSCELYQICEKLDEAGMNIDYDKVQEYASYDGRLGGSHMTVPGHDGVLGARGHCFPKDLNALIAVAKEIGIEPTLMKGAWEKNLEVIPSEHRDWEKMHGRAVSKKNKT